MRTFKLIDLSVQVLLLVISGASVISGGGEIFFYSYFLGLLFWNTLSIFLNGIFFRPQRMSYKAQRWFIFMQPIFIFGYLAMVFFPDYLPFDLGFKEDIFLPFLIYCALLPFYYLILTCVELRMLNEIHDQVSLLDLKH